MNSGASVTFDNIWFDVPDIDFIEPVTVLTGLNVVAPARPDASVVDVVGLLYGRTDTVSDFMFDDYINYSVNIDPDKID